MAKKSVKRPKSKTRRPAAKKAAARKTVKKKPLARRAKAPARKPAAKALRAKKPAAQRSIMADVAAALADASTSPESVKALVGHDEDYEFELAEGDVFHVRIADGKASVHPGRTPKTGYFETTYIESDRKTLRQLCSGKLRPVDAIEQLRFNMVIRMYEGCQITMLFRIAGERALKRFLEKNLA